MEKELIEEDIGTIESELDEVQKEFENAWNSNNTKNVVKLFAEGAMRVGFFGEMAHGKTEIEKALKKVLDLFPDGKLKFDKGIVRPLGENFAVWQGTFHISNGKNKEPAEGYTIQVLKREGNRWLILEAHPKLIDREKRREFIPDE